MGHDSVFPIPRRVALLLRAPLLCSTTPCCPQNPGLASLDAGSQVQPAVRALLAAGVGAQDAWFVLSKKWALMEHPAVLSRWWVETYSTVLPYR